jgi:hypothetical protein
MTARLTLPLVAGLLVFLGCGGGGAADDPDGFRRESGTLRSGDETLTSGEFADSHTLNAEAGQWIEVAMTSTEFDPYVILRPPSCADISGPCEQQVDNDDFGTATDAFVWHRADEAGRWTVLATSSRPDESGAYNLAYRAVAAGEAPATPGVALGSGRTERGRLETGDQTLNSGEFADSYAFFGRSGDRVTVDLRSSTFDPYLILQQPSAPQLDNDDWEGATDHARIEQALGADGVYTVLVTTYQPGMSGDYELQIMPGGAGTPDGGTPPEGETTPAGDAAPAGTSGQTGGEARDPFAK